MTSLLIKNGRVIDPASKFDKVTNIFIADGKIKAIGTKTPRADKTIDAKGLIVAPGLIDMHVHLREPGMEAEETIASGVNAAVAGGFTSIACMPNTDPVVDNEASTEFVYLQAKRANLANVFPIGAITKGSLGEQLAEMGQMVRGGAVGFSDDGNPVKSAEVFRRALEYAKMFDKAVIDHCEDKDLTQNGVMNEGQLSVVLGLPGMPGIAEEIMVNRDIRLARLTNGQLHITHLTTARSVELVRQAKQEGIKVTGEVTPHHFTLTDECVHSFDPNFKMNPPLRTWDDVKALREGLKDGTIDVIASDHAPHSLEEKDVEFSQAPFGVIGMESMLSLVVTELVEKKVLSWPEAIAKLTINPARILGIAKGTLKIGKDADITIIDPRKNWTINPDEFKSKSRNCPFAGWKVKGKAIKTIIAGREV